MAGLDGVIHGANVILFYSAIVSKMAETELGDMIDLLVQTKVGLIFFILSLSLSLPPLT